MAMIVFYLWVKFMASRVTMHVVCFWGYYLVQALSTDCWIMFRWVFSISILLGIVARWPGFPLFYVHFAGGEVWGGLLMFDCTGHINANADFHGFSGFDLHLSTIAIFCLVLLWIWLSFKCHCFQSYGVLPFRWIVSFSMVCGFLLAYLILFCFDLLSTPTPLTFICIWWQVSFSPFSPFRMQTLRCSCLCCLDQHVYMLWLHPRMLGQPLNGKGFQFWMMLLLYSHADVGLDLSLLWDLPSFLLSFLLALKRAHAHVVLLTCVCWHLDCVQTTRDEVRGKSPFVYEDACSETKVFFLSSKFWIEFLLSWCTTPELNPCHHLLTLKLEVNFAIYPHASGLQPLKAEQNTLLLGSFSEVWCSTKTVSIAVYSVFTGKLNCIIGLYYLWNVSLKFIWRAGTGFPQGNESQ